MKNEQKKTTLIKCCNRISSSKTTTTTTKPKKTQTAKQNKKIFPDNIFTYPEKKKINKKNKLFTKNLRDIQNNRQQELLFGDC